MWLTEGLAEYFGKTKKFNPEDIRRKNSSRTRRCRSNLQPTKRRHTLFTRWSSLIEVTLLFSLNLRKVISKQNKIYLKSVQFSEQIFFKSFDIFQQKNLNF